MKNVRAPLKYNQTTKNSKKIPKLILWQLSNNPLMKKTRFKRRTVMTAINRLAARIQNIEL
jgi:hypothetical protein